MADEGRPGTPTSDGPPAGEAAESGPRHFVADTVRKAVLTGLGAVFLTEEGARKLARDWKLPKDIASFVSAQASGARDEIVRVVTEEVRKFFESEALRREFLRLVTSMSIEVRAEISLKPAQGERRVEPEIKVSSVRPRLRRDRGAARAAEPEAPGDAGGGVADQGGRPKDER